MATSEVYTPTTVSNPKSSCCLVPSDYLDKTRFLIKILEVLLSFLAFILEEAVNTCINCTALYFFEFVSCTAFLFTLLLLILLATVLHQRVGITYWSNLDFYYTTIITILFFISSVVFAADNSGSSLETSAVVFGFLAMLVFLIDLVLFVRTSGLPWQQGGKPEGTNGGQAAVEAPPEAEKLNTATNDAIQ